MLIECTEPCGDIEDMEFCCVNCEQLSTCSGYCRKSECQHNCRLKEVKNGFKTIKRTV